MNNTLDNSLYKEKIGVHHKITFFKDKVRILEKKENFDKGKQKFSKELYTIDKREGYELLIRDEKRKLKHSELLKATTVSNPILQAYI